MKGKTIVATAAVFNAERWWPSFLHSKNSLAEYMRAHIYAFIFAKAIHLLAFSHTSAHMAAAPELADAMVAAKITPPPLSLSFLSLSFFLLLRNSNVRDLMDNCLFGATSEVADGWPMVPSHTL